MSTLSFKINATIDALLDFKGNYLLARTNLSRADKNFWWVCATLYAFSLIVMGYNYFFVGYVDYALIMLAPPAALPGFLLVYWVTLRYLPAHPKSCQLILCLLYTAAFIYFTLLICGAAMLTPSTHLLNQMLLHWDLALGFNQLPLIHWTLAHPRLLQLLNMAYASWSIQIFLAPLALMLLGAYENMRRWFIAGLLAMLIACMIYYFWPSLPPASVYPEHLFQPACYECMDRFFLIRQYQPYEVGLCGLIVFPSCHVIYAVFNTYYLRKTRWLFWPLLLLNALLIASTVMMGMHFLVDVISGFFVAGLCIYAATRLSRYPAFLP